MSVVRHRPDLPRGDDREAHPFLCQHIERLIIERGLGQPHAFGIATEPTPEVGNPPADFGEFVAPARQREDRVVVRLRDGVAVSETRDALAVGVEHTGIGVRRRDLEPLEQRRPEVEADVLERVDDAADASIAAEDARRNDRAIAFLLDARVPVVVGRGGGFSLDLFQPRVFPRGLVEVTVDDNRSHNYGDGDRGTGDGEEAETFGRLTSLREVSRGFPLPRRPWPVAGPRQFVSLLPSPDSRQYRAHRFQYRRKQIVLDAQLAGKVGGTR